MEENRNHRLLRLAAGGERRQFRLDLACLLQLGVEQRSPVGLAPFRPFRGGHAANSRTASEMPAAAGPASSAAGPINGLVSPHRSASRSAVAKVRSMPRVR